MSPRPIVALAGGVGAARFLSGLVQVVDSARITAIVNTGDDRDFFGLRVCPDLDIITYTLAGRVRRETGWGLEGDSFHCLEALKRFRSDVWFGLGDGDLATHIQRTARLREGAALVQVVREITQSFGLEIELLPMTEQPSPTIVERSDGSRLDFQQYLVRDGAPADVKRVDLTAAAATDPAPGVLEAIRGAEVLLICPSNPVVSIGPIRAVRGIEAALRERRDAVAVSPIIGGRPVRGPADRLLPALGAEVSARGVAGLYAPIAQAMLIDRVDAEQLGDIEALGLRARAEDTLMKTPEVARSVAAATLELAGQQP